MRERVGLNCFGVAIACTLPSIPIRRSSGRVSKLEIGGFAVSSDHNKNEQRFRSLYGSNSIVYAQTWEDFHTGPVQEARIGNKRGPVSPAFS